MIPLLVRLMIAAGMGAASYFFVKDGGVERIKRAFDADDPDRVDMLHDPNCDIYFPAREGVRRRVDGERLYFCSETCADEYSELDNDE